MTKHLPILFIAITILVSPLRSEELETIINDFECIIYVINPQNGQELFYYNSLPDSLLAFPIGSTIKVFTSLAAYRQRVLKPDEIFVCHPTSIDSPVTSRCWFTPGHGEQDFVMALGNSCNAYFLELARKVEYKGFCEILKDFNIIDNKLTLCQNNQSKAAAMVGLDYSVTVNLKSLLLAYSALFNGGDLYNVDGTVIRKLSLPGQFVNLIREGMKYGVSEGTSIQAQKKVSATKIIAKTGTAPYYVGDIYDPLKTHALFLGFAPVEKPLIGVMVFVKEGTGAEEGATKGGEILEYFIRKHY